MFKGVYSVLPTPFRGGADVDFVALGRVVELAVRAGVDGVTALGVTAEVAKLSERERAGIVETVLAHVDDRAAVIVGASADGLRTCIDLATQARTLGASGVMISPPRLAKLNSDVVVAHYAAVADAVDLPIIVQDYPPVCGFSMEPALLARIARDVPPARTIKLEDPPTPQKTARILSAAEGVDVSVLGGLGAVFLFEELLAGASGAMTGFAYPEVLVKVVSLFRAGDRQAAAEAFFPFVPLMRFEFQEGIGLAIRKELYRRRGALADGSTRPPGPSLDEATRDALDRVLAWTARQEGASWISD